MKRWLPFPAMTLFLLVTWLVLKQSLAPGQVLLGAVLAILLGLLFARLRPPTARVRRWDVALALFLRVLGDIARSNIAVLWIILGGRRRPVRSGFVSIPLQLSNPYGLAVLACIITSTPGTIWMSHLSRERRLLIHVFDLVDEGEWIRTITHRYERPLRTIFE